GWQFVVLAERFAGEAEAREAAARLATDLGRPVSVFRIGAGGPVAIGAPGEPPVEGPAVASGVGELVARARTAHGGEAGGAAALARGAAVHFVFTRAIALGGKPAEVRHDYWREGGSRRLAVDTRGAGKDSLAVATTQAAWLRVGDVVQGVDVGVTIGTVDAFAPEAILTLALDVQSLLSAPEVERFQPLEGAESGVRVGQGGDESEPGLSFVDLDPATGRVVRARYVTEAGPVIYEMQGWREVAQGVVVPASVRIVRADGREEIVRVEVLEIAPRAPAGTFDKPAGS
ncbi:MAG: hypothetical protein ACOZNI_20310, partial [Myxococcota bacterium]